jgi:hypothetical protein
MIVERGLTLTQPWAGLVASGIKLVENRPRNMAPKTLYGKRFAIHASRETKESERDRIYSIARELFTDSSFNEAWWRLARVHSAIIAVATLSTFVTAADCDVLPPGQRRWFFGPIGYVLCDVIALPEPIERRGALGFWKTTPKEQQLIAAQLAA